MDKAGNLWFGTTGEGVYRYDGKLFSQFTVKDGLSNNTVWCMAEDNNGNIWCGTDKGISRFDGKSFSHVPLPSGSGEDPYMQNAKSLPSSDTDVWSIMQAKNGIIWFGTRNGLYCYDGSSFSLFTDNKSILNKDRLQLKMIDSMLEDENGSIWFCSGMPPGGEGICRFDGKSLTNVKPYGDGWIRKIIRDRAGNIYIATRHNGVCRYNALSGEFVNISAKPGINNSSVTSISPDSKGNLWIATELGSGQLGEDGGVWCYNGKTFTRFTTREGLIHNGVYTIVEDKAGNIWFGTRNVGLSMYDGKSFTTFSE